MTNKRTSENAFESAIEAVLLHNSYSRINGKGFDRERAIFPERGASRNASRGLVTNSMKMLI